MPQDSPQNSLANPFEFTADDGYFWMKGNLHSHSTNSDGKPSPQERVDGYVGQGYDFLCVSDHYRITRTETLTCPDEFVLVQGAELHPHNPFGGQTHHFLAYNITEDMDTQKMPPQHVINEVNEQGGNIWLAHPYWSSVNILRDTIPLKGLAGVEVFNSTCRRVGRGEGAVHWDDWMSMEDKLYPALGNDDSHALDSDKRDTYQGWTWARVKERTPEAIMDALVKGAGYSSNGPEIRNIKLERVDDGSDGRRIIEATVESSEAQRYAALCDSYGAEHYQQGETFESATFRLRPNARWVRFEIIGPNGSKAWSNPLDLTGFE
ncbi:MAG: CehA/McbA family metallohydrolase [Planctomycetota bacterium]|jgi:hypothetical protein|nr:CehA/McbA family metallohydrolase [Planctomycetota bacterium]MDP7250564.1 CehA/McbA family metallohydrolase [Planctomycetota bacterium]